MSRYIDGIRDYFIPLLLVTYQMVAGFGTQIMGESNVKITVPGF